MGNKPSWDLARRWHARAQPRKWITWRWSTRASRPRTAAAPWSCRPLSRVRTACTVPTVHPWALLNNSWGCLQALTDVQKHRALPVVLPVRRTCAVKEGVRLRRACPSGDACGEARRRGRCAAAVRIGDRARHGEEGEHHGAAGARGGALGHAQPQGGHPRGRARCLGGACFCASRSSHASAAYQIQGMHARLGHYMPRRSLHMQAASAYIGIASTKKRLRGCSMSAAQGRETGIIGWPILIRAESLQVSGCCGRHGGCGARDRVGVLPAAGGRIH